MRSTLFWDITKRIVIFLKDVEGTAMEATFKGRETRE
jgi:hypothetical protein